MYASSALRRDNLFNYIYSAHAIEPLQRRKSAILVFHFVSVARAQHIYDHVIDFFSTEFKKNRCLIFPENFEKKSCSFVNCVRSTKS